MITKDEANKALLAAAEAKVEDVNAVINALESGAEINAVDQYGNTALIWAADKGHDNIVKFLLAQEGVNINAAESSGCTALYYACSNGRDKVVELLLAEKDININSLNHIKMTPLIEAVKSKHAKVVDMLLAKNGVDINAIDAQNSTALMWAAIFGNEEILKSLCAYGADPFITYGSGETALNLATTDGTKAIIESHQAYMQLKYGLIPVLPAVAMILSDDHMLQASAAVLAFGASFCFNGGKSYMARSFSIYLASTALWNATTLISEEYAIYCQVAAVAIAGINFASAAYPYLTAQRPDKGI